MNRTEAIQAAHPWMTSEDTLNVSLYQHQGAQLISGLRDGQLEDSMNKYTERITRASREQLEPFVHFLKDRYLVKQGEHADSTHFIERWTEGQKLLEGRATTVKARSAPRNSIQMFVGV